jgi:hypothetical protein
MCFNTSKNEGGCKFGELEGTALRVRLWEGSGAV